LFHRRFSILVCITLMTTSCSLAPPADWDPLSLKKAPSPPVPANKPLLGGAVGTRPAPCLPGRKPNIEEIGKGTNECTPDRVTRFGGGG
jgi:hypothetical protein